MKLMKIPLGNSLLTISIMKCSDGSCCVLQRSLAPSPFLIEKSSVPILMSFKDQGECISSIRPGELPNWSYSSSPLNSKHISHMLFLTSLTCFAKYRASFLHSVTLFASSLSWPMFSYCFFFYLLQFYLTFLLLTYHFQKVLNNKCLMKQNK